jgi:hypothetical protein
MPSSNYQIIGWQIVASAANTGEQIYVEVELIHPRDICASLLRAIIRDGTFDPPSRGFKSNKSDQLVRR